MDQARKRQIRLVIALSVAVMLAVALVYTSFSSASDAMEPSEVHAAGPGPETYQLTGRVKSHNDVEGGANFVIADRDGEGETLRVRYEGIVPDPFRDGREVIVTGRLNAESVFIAEKDSLITKCPSKFSEEAEGNPNIIIDE